LTGKPKNSILELFKNSIKQQFSKSSFNDLLNEDYHWDEVIDESIEPFLKSNILEVIDRFAKSESFSSAGRNSKLLIKIAEFLSPESWESVLEAFFLNDQLYYSSWCHKEFISLFNKSLELSNDVQPYWLIFRNKLDKFDNKTINNLKHLIDSHTK
jgi:hypothetical protein